MYVLYIIRVLVNAVLCVGNLILIHFQLNFLVKSEYDVDLCLGNVIATETFLQSLLSWL